MVAWYNAGRSIKGKVVHSHLPPFRNLGNFVHSHLPVSFGRDNKSRWCLLSGVYARGSKRSHIGGKCVTCSGLTNSRWTLNALQRAPSSISEKERNLRWPASQEGRQCPLDGCVFNHRTQRLVNILPDKCVALDTLCQQCLCCLVELLQGPQTVSYTRQCSQFLCGAVVFFPVFVNNFFSVIFGKFRIKLFINSSKVCMLYKCTEIKNNPTSIYDSSLAAEWHTTSHLTMTVRKTGYFGSKPTSLSKG